VKSLERITFCHIHDVYQLLEMLWTPEMKRYKLVVIDSFATLFLPIRGDAFNDCMYIKVTSHQLIKSLSVKNIEHGHLWDLIPLYVLFVLQPSVYWTKWPVIWNDWLWCISVSFLLSITSRGGQGKEQQKRKEQLRRRLSLAATGAVYLPWGCTANT